MKYLDMIEFEGKMNVFARYHKFSKPLSEDVLRIYDSDTKSYETIKFMNLTDNNICGISFMSNYYIFRRYNAIDRSFHSILSNYTIEECIDYDKDYYGVDLLGSNNRDVIVTSGKYGTLYHMYEEKPLYMEENNAVAYIHEHSTGRSIKITYAVQDMSKLRSLYGKIKMFRG